MKQYETRLIQLERPGEPGIKDLFRRLIVAVGSIFYRLFTFLFHPPVEEKEYKVMGRQSHFKIQIFRGAVPHDKRSKVCFCKWGW